MDRARLAAATPSSRLSKRPDAISGTRLLGQATQLGVRKRRSAAFEETAGPPLPSETTDVTSLSSLGAEGNPTSRTGLAETTAMPFGPPTSLRSASPPIVSAAPTPAVDTQTGRNPCVGLRRVGLLASASPLPLARVVSPVASLAAAACRPLESGVGATRLSSTVSRLLTSGLGRHAVTVTVSARHEDADDARRRIVTRR